MFEYVTPTDLPSIRASLRTLNAEIREQLATLSVDEFLAPQGEYWSPAGHLRHLIKSVRPLAGALAKPKLVLWFLFGKAKKASRSHDEIVQVYLDALESGRAQAGKFGPSSRKHEVDDAAFQELVLQRWQKVCSELDAVLERWDEQRLDRYQLPHPVLGKLTVREMLFFTLYHNKHHASRVFERRVAA